MKQNSFLMLVISAWPERVGTNKPCKGLNKKLPESRFVYISILFFEGKIKAFLPLLGLFIRENLSFLFTKAKIGKLKTPYFKGFLVERGS